MEQKLEALKDCIQTALYKKWLNNIVVGHIAVGDCNREEKNCVLPEIQMKVCKK